MLPMHSASQGGHAPRPAGLPVCTMEVRVWCVWGGVGWGGVKYPTSMVVEGAVYSHPPSLLIGIVWSRGRLMQLLLSAVVVASNSH